MDRDESLAVLEREARRILTLVDGAGVDTARPVPSCPGWTLVQVPDHLGRVYAMVATVLQGDPDSPPDREKIPSRLGAQSPTDWMRERFEILMPLLREIPEDSKRWNFATGPASPVGFWWRRQMHETLIHRVDAELAAGRPITAAEPEIAADGIGDYLTLTGFRRVEQDGFVPGEGVTIHLHATDAGPDAEWTIDTANNVYAFSHLKADAALRGPAWLLDRWCWQREVPDGHGAEEEPALEILGDRQAAEQWRRNL